MAPIALTPPGLEEPSPEPATGAHGTAPPMPLPQGLAEAVRGELAAAARDAAAERLEELGPILGPAREAVLRDVDLRVDERVGELWTKAKQMFGAMQQKHSSQSKALVEEVTRCQANCEALEAENVQLKQALHDLLQRFAQLGKVFHGTDGLLPMPMCPPAPAAAKTPPTKPQAPPVQTAAHNAAEAAAFKEAIGLLSPQPPGLDFLGTMAPVPAFPIPSVSMSESLGGNLTPCGSQFRTPVSLARIQAAKSAWRRLGALWVFTQCATATTCLNVASIGAGILVVSLALLRVVRVAGALLGEDANATAPRHHARTGARRSECSSSRSFACLHSPF
mmetsp:Transcript_20487/g.66274  ORF Transcript_20487/g.66274 Transcript_20487/m.66274 type:complete len:335 (+) Transcript_20487:106-1110(+)